MKKSKQKVPRSSISVGDLISDYGDWLLVIGKHHLKESLHQPKEKWVVKTYNLSDPCGDGLNWIFEHTLLFEYNEGKINIISFDRTHDK